MYGHCRSYSQPRCDERICFFQVRFGERFKLLVGVYDCFSNIISLNNMSDEELFVLMQSNYIGHAFGLRSRTRMSLDVTLISHYRLSADG